VLAGVGVVLAPLPAVSVEPTSLCALLASIRALLGHKAGCSDGEFGVDVVGGVVFVVVTGSVFVGEADTVLVLFLLSSILCILNCSTVRFVVVGVTALGDTSGVVGVSVLCGGCDSLLASILAFLCSSTVGVLTGVVVVGIWFLVGVVVAGIFTGEGVFAGT